MTVPEPSEAVKLRALIPRHPGRCRRRREMLRARALISRGPQSPEIGRASRARQLTGAATNPPGCLQPDLAAISQGAAIGSRPSDEMLLRPSGSNSGTKAE
ncbi:hypothetical protein COCCADRAFT_36172 [Bipolaris zeicola 26-R-13]|uniref:Uncharacterized protein n=1 Tax=Cochliobolus carbonum (strain 26-R-13) TaxID=930089 RepID=W6Y9C0_COCC2|nr:uncharacterized protein COCCADRAFT_36172 [Bipolaris zeicola 26-R-13]EUC34115.1 hypothetical protein COCCADRAFT_36172 [Bipolaris zeicola 26-R-13]